MAVNKRDGVLDRYPSPLRYPGGKGRISNFLKLVVAENSMRNLRYVEPYAGGASIALSLLFDGYAKEIVVNDMNKGVYHFWNYVKNDAQSFCRRIMKTDVTIDEWRRQKAVYADHESPEEDLAFATFFLNRTNRSGIISTGGVIGGLKQEGKWKIDARYNKEQLCKRIMRVSEHASSITIRNCDAYELIKEKIDWKGSSLMYLDPPYYVKGAQLYDNFYKHENHSIIAESMKEINSPWITSYDASPEIMQMYSQYRRIDYQLSYSASRRASGNEVMFFSPSLKIPDCESPAKAQISQPNQLLIQPEADI